MNPGREPAPASPTGAGVKSGLADRKPVYSPLGELYVREVQSRLLAAGTAGLWARRGEIPAEVAEALVDDLLGEASEGLDHYLAARDRLDRGLAS
jgi:hypothetical protein